jgi:signal transduction histidine kinase/CheY-like chemotaxis protein
MTMVQAARFAGEVGSLPHRLLCARLDLAYRLMPYAVLAGIVGMAGLWAGVRRMGWGQGADGWLVAHVALAGLRYAMGWRYRSLPRPLRNPAKWYAALAATTAMIGLVWCGFAAAVYADPIAPIWAHLMLFVLFAIISVTPFTLGVLPAASFALLIPITGAALYGAHRVFGTAWLPAALFIGAWVGLILLLAHRTRSDHARMIVLQIHNENLLQEARAAVTRSRTSEERLRALLTLSADWHWEIDQDLRFVPGGDVAPAAPMVWRDSDMPPHANFGKHPWELPDSVPLDTNWNAHRATLERHEAFRDFAVKRITPERNELYFLVSGAPMFDGAGRFLGYRGTTKDITGIKRIEAELALAKAEAEARNEQLRASEEKFRTLVELSSDWYWERDAQHRLVSIAGHPGSLEGRPRLPLGTLPWETPNVEPAGTTWDEHRQLIGAREPFRDLLLRVHFPGERERYLLVSGGPVFGSDGVFAGYRGTSKDVTEQQYVEHELARAKLAAEAASRAKSQFLANMSHEIRTPMNGIFGALQLLARTELTADQRKLSRIAHGSAEALLQIIDDILDFSKIEAGKLAIELAPFDLAACVRDAVELLRPRAADKGLAMECLLAEDLPKTVVGDAGRLRQVLLNLLGNAVKFTSSGRIAVQVDVQRIPGREPMLCFAVEDSGIGIDAAVQERLFQPFNQGDNSMHRRYGGTGLGLAISKYLAEAMGGEIGVESAPGRGTTFRFWVPLRNVADEVEVAAVTTATLPRMAELSVLIVEDNTVNQEVARTMLRHLGAVNDVASDGAKAVSRIENGQRYDLILMDCQMPGMDGFEATRRIRQFEAQFDKPRSVIIALTANAMQGDRERCLAAGMDDYLAKPYSITALSATIARWTQTSEGGTAPALGSSGAEHGGVARIERAVDDGQKKNL